MPRRESSTRLRREFPEWGAKLGEDHLIDLSVLGQVSDTALTRDSAITFAESGLPNTFVPGRNLLFFTFAAAVGYRRGLRHLVGGMCETDYSGYPDCRDDTLKSLQATLSLGMDHRFVIHTPLMWRDKAATWELARELGGDALVELIREESHSCYLGDRGQRHDWGYGCGDLPGLRVAAQGVGGVSLGARNRPMSYAVKEIFYTLQGEGALTGRPAVFCRFAGCNLWSGREEDRATARLHLLRHRFRRHGRHRGRPLRRCRRRSPTRSPRCGRRGTARGLSSAPAASRCCSSTRR